MVQSHPKHIDFHSNIPLESSMPEFVAFVHPPKDNIDCLNHDQYILFHFKKSIKIQFELIEIYLSQISIRDKNWTENWQLIWQISRNNTFLIEKRELER